MVVLFPVLAELYEFIASEILPFRLAIFGVPGELLLNNGLSSNACMVAARDVER